MTGRSIGETFNPRRNSLNALRLALALIVVLSHSLTLGASTKGNLTAEDFLNSSPGLIAVFGFFGISGFLIARSAERHNLGRYLWQRFVRIFPGYWVCLVVAALVFGIIAWEHTRAAGLSHYFHSATGPFQYVYHDLLLRQSQPGIAGTPTDVALPGVWNGSIWTLQYEFYCYVLLGVLAIVGLLRRRALVVSLALGVWAIAAYYTFTQTALSLGKTGFDEARMLGFVPLFLTGALVYLYRDKLPDSGWLAAGCGAACIASLWLPYGNGVDYSAFPIVTAAGLSSVFLVYPMIWLGIHLPLELVGAHNDYSYGIYIYAWPLQQLLATWDVERFGMPAFMAFSVAVTVAAAVASWWLVEKHALKLKGIGRPVHEENPLPGRRRAGGHLRRVRGL